MRYSGGKEKIAAKIASVLQAHVDRSGAYAEPFLGGASVFSRVCAQSKHGSDVNPWLICTWQAALEGWEPPEVVTEEDYARLKRDKPVDDPMTAFAGFGCSFGGKWFGGFARNATGRNYAAEACRGIAKKLRGFGACLLETASYQDVPFPSGAVIYCDPPYANTTDGYGTARFDHIAFWQWVREREIKGHPTFVSEYTAPPDFVSIADFPKRVTMAKQNGYASRTEKLFRYAGA